MPGSRERVRHMASRRSAGAQSTQWPFPFDKARRNAPTLPSHHCRYEKYSTAQRFGGRGWKTGLATPSLDRHGTLYAPHAAWLFERTAPLLNRGDDVRLHPTAVAASAGVDYAARSLRHPA